MTLRIDLLMSVFGSKDAADLIQKKPRIVGQLTVSTETVFKSIDFLRDTLQMNNATIRTTVRKRPELLMHTEEKLCGNMRWIRKRLF